MRVYVKAKATKMRSAKDAEETDEQEEGGKDVSDNSLKTGKKIHTSERERKAKEMRSAEDIRGNRKLNT